MTKRRKFDSMLRLETERLLLRQGRFREAAAIAKFWKDEQTFLEPFEPLAKSERTTTAYWRENFKADRLKAHRREALRLFLYDKKTPAAPLGMIHFSQFVPGAFQAGYLGYLLAEKAQGQGFMTESLKAAIAFVFKEWNFHRLMANHLPENRKSAAVLVRLGFETEGIAKDYLCIAGKWRDHVLTSLVNPNWAEPGKKS